MTKRKELEVMAKEVSALNTFALVQYLHERHSSLDLEDLIAQICQMFPCYVENLKTGDIEQVSIEHLQNHRYWFSNRFVQAFHDLILKHIPDPRLGFKIGSTIYKTQPLLRTAVGIPLLGIHRVANKVSREAARFNRTKQYNVQKLGKGCVKIRITHNPGIVTGEFAMQWNAGCFFSYARLVGATDISVDLRCVDPGPDGPDDKRRAIWDFEIRYREPGLLTRLAKAVLFNLPWIKELTERAEAVEDEHQDQIVNRDNIIRLRTADLTKANETMRVEIAERKRAEEALLQSERQLQRYITAIDDVGLGLCVIDADCRIRIMNKTMIGWFGDHRGDACHRIIMQEECQCTACKLTEVIERGKKVRYQPTMADGRTFEIVATPIHNNDGSISKMEIIHNITEQKNQEQDRLDLSRQKEELKKLASLKTMAGAIAHRFNNAMVGVQGNLELLTLYLPDNSKEHLMALHAFKSARGASQVGAMMLSYVGQQPLNLLEVSLTDIVRESVTATKALLHSQIVLKFIPLSRPIYCSVDRQQIREVIDNILINAIESLGNSSGEIEITFGTDFFTTKSFPIAFQDSKLKDGMYSFCQIKDSGHGVGLEDLPKVFEPFYTTRVLGRGLGLSLTAGIMQTHQGAITFESTLGTGSTVRMLLPSLEVSSQQTLPASEDVGTTTVRLSGHILLVDDEAIVLEVGRKILLMLGFTVHTAVNGREAVEKVSRQYIKFCAIVMDVSMPEMDGIAAMEAIRKMNPAIPILLSSGYSEDKFSSLENLQIKADGFLGKPFQVSDIRSNLQKLLS